VGLSSGTWILRELQPVRILHVSARSHPSRPRISCHAAIDKAAFAPFYKAKAHEVHQRPLSSTGNPGERSGEICGSFSGSHAENLGTNSGADAAQPTADLYCQC
jgi:hypothetical protein